MSDEVWKLPLTLPVTASDGARDSTHLHKKHDTSLIPITKYRRHLTTLRSSQALRDIKLSSTNIKAAVILLVVLACVAVNARASRQPLSTNGRPKPPQHSHNHTGHNHTTHNHTAHNHTAAPGNHTAHNHTAGNHTTHNHTMPVMPVKAGKGGMIEIGKIGHGRRRVTKPSAYKQPFRVQSVQDAVLGEDESCYSIALREYCPSNTQANCCEYLDSEDNWQGCELASNLYTCTHQFEDKPATVCCS